MASEAGNSPAKTEPAATAPRPLVAGAPPPSGPTELSDRDPAGGGGGGAARHPATSGPTRRLVLAGIVSGESVRALARRLDLHRSTVQDHVDRLLLDRVLARAGQRLVPGPAYVVETARTEGGGSDRYPPGNATAGGQGLMTDGKRTFAVRGPPANYPHQMPGFVKTSLSGRGADAKKRKNHLFRWTRDGLTHELLLSHQPTTEGYGLQYLKCSPSPRKADLGTDDKETLWDRFTSAAIQEWARLAGVPVDPEPRRSREVRLAYPGVMPAGMKWRRSESEADDTPAPRTLETRSEAVAQFIETGPQVQQAQGDALAELEARLAHASQREERLARATQKVVGLIERSQDERALLVQAIAAPFIPPSSAQPFPPKPGVEFQ